MSREHEPVDGGFVCRDCMATFSTPLGMARHREVCRRRDDPELVTDGGERPTCHYCGEEYEVSTSLEESYHDDPERHNVCSSCLFDVVANDAELEPLPRFRESDDELETDGGALPWCPSCSCYSVPLEDRTCGSCGSALEWRGAE